MAVSAILATLMLTLAVTTPSTATVYVLSAHQDVSLVSDVNLDGDNRLIVGYRLNEAARSLVQFELESIPLDCTLQSATMYLYYIGSQTIPEAATHKIEVHRVLQDWAETEATRTNRLAVVPWNVPGVGLDDIDAETSSIYTAIQDTPPAEEHTYVEFDILDAMIAWIENGEPNNGLLLKAEDEVFNPGAPTELIKFANKDAPVNEQPKVRVACSG